MVSQWGPSTKQQPFPSRPPPQPPRLDQTQPCPAPASTRAPWLPTARTTLCTAPAARSVPGACVSEHRTAKRCPGRQATLPADSASGSDPGPHRPPCSQPLVAPTVCEAACWPQVRPPASTAVAACNTRTCGHTHRHLLTCRRTREHPAPTRVHTPTPRAQAHTQPTLGVRARHPQGRLPAGSPCPPVSRLGGREERARAGQGTRWPEQERAGAAQEPHVDSKADRKDRKA